MARLKPQDPDNVWGTLADPSPMASPAGIGAAEEIAARLQRLIIERKLAEGERLPSERDLAVLLGASRPTVSQAIRTLVVRGLIESRRGSGAYVTRRPEAGIAASVDLMLSLNRDSVSQMNELRFWLEDLGIVRAVEFGTEAEFDEAAVALERLRTSTGDTAALMSADNRFHSVLVQASRNAYLASIFQSVHAAVVQFEYEAWITRGTPPGWLRRESAGELMELHEPLLAAVRARDVEAARASVLRHHEVMVKHIAAVDEAP